jgi:hypothetical protein
MCFSWRCRGYSASYSRQPADLRNRVIPGTLILTRELGYLGRYNDYATSWRFLGSNTGDGKCFFSFSKRLEPTQPSTEWVAGYLPGSKTSGGVNLTTHPRLMPRLRVSGAVLHTPIFHHGVDKETSPFFNCHLHDDRKTLQNMEAHKRPFVAGGLNPDLSAITDTCLV